MIFQFSNRQRSTVDSHAPTPTLSSRAARRLAVTLTSALMLGLAGCGTQKPEVPAPRPDEVRAKIVRLIPSNIPPTTRLPLMY